jgi:hypothetical protein
LRRHDYAIYCERHGYAMHTPAVYITLLLRRRHAYEPPLFTLTLYYTPPPCRITLSPPKPLHLFTPCITPLRHATHTPTCHTITYYTPPMTPFIILRHWGAGCRRRRHSTSTLINYYTTARISSSTHYHYEREPVYALYWPRRPRESSTRHYYATLITHAVYVMSHAATPGITAAITPRDIREIYCPRRKPLCYIISAASYGAARAGFAFTIENAFISILPIS